MVKSIIIKNPETITQLMKLKYEYGLKSLEETINFIREEYNASPRTAEGKGELISKEEETTIES